MLENHQSLSLSFLEKKKKGVKPVDPAGSLALLDKKIKKNYCLSEL